MPKDNHASAPGKIILSGEYAVLFGHRGIAIPSDLSIEAAWTDDASMPSAGVVWEGHESPDPRMEYVLVILKTLEPNTGPLKGTLTISGNLPLGKGMGSSTALIIAISRCLLGSGCTKIARNIENALAPDNSGIDFSVIWAAAPVLFQRDVVPEIIEFDRTVLQGYQLVDTGEPGERTPDLVGWIRLREGEIKNPIAIIGECTERILRGEPLRDVLRDHHRAQVTLGVVPESAQKIIADIEKNGGTAKVLGAGGRTGGGGMVLALPPPGLAA